MKKILLMFFAACLSAAVYAQTVTGKVTDQDGFELPGVSILIKGTSSGTSTGIDGTYSLSAKSGDVLVFSFVGFTTEEITVGNETVINVTMLPDVKQLQEVVVIGYGEIEAGDATGAISSVKAEDFNAGVIASPEQLFQGRAAGVQITTSSGEPGAGVNIRIRGTSSIRSGNNPLFVVDGVPLAGNDVSAGVGSPMGSSSARNPLNFLNPNDIESIDILKDASATAIYGSRGANGVVIITTKKGKDGRGTLDYNYSLGLAKVVRRYDLLNADEFVDAWSDFNPGVNTSTIDYGNDTDWQEEILRTAVTNNHNLSFSNATPNGNYRASLSFQDQEGVVEESGLQRLTARFNSDNSFLNDKLKISQQLTVANINDQTVLITNNSGFVGDLMAAAIKLNPTLPVRNPDGTPFQLSNTEPNPIALLEYSDSFTNTIRALGSFSAEYEIIDGLSFRTSVGLDRSISSRTDAYSRDLNIAGVNGIGRLIKQEITSNNSTFENYFNYTKSFGDIEFNGILGYSYQTFENTFSGFQATGFRTSDLDIMINNMSSVDLNGNGTVAPINSSSTTDELQSYYTRVNFDINDKYIVTGTLRADGSSRFGGNNKYGYFPAAAFKWRLGNEAFMPETFEDFAFRAGFGVTGNQEFGHNLYTDRQRYGNWGINDGGSPDGGGLTDVAFANPDLRWESTSQINLGIDFGFLDGRVNGSLDFYNKVTRDMLIRVVAAQPAPNPFVWENLDAEVVNTGIDLALNFIAVDNDNLNWDIATNFSYNKNIVNGPPSLLINTGEINGQGLTGAFAQRIADGQPLYAYFLREFAGFSEDGTVQEYVGGDVQKFLDKSPLPKVNAGITNTFKYGNWNLSVFFTGQFGHYIYSNTGNAFFTAGSLAGGRNVTRDVVGNGEARTNSPDVSTRFLEKGDFVRFQNLTLSYQIPENFDKIQSINVNLVGQNLAVFTNYSGQDPEVNVDKQIDGVPSFGIDYTTYPRARTWTMGFNIKF